MAVLNTCTKEELEETDEDLALVSPAAAAEESAERRKVIKNKIMAVGRMARVFALLRCVFECTLHGDSELIYMTERNRRKCLNSRAFLDQPSCPTERSHLDLKGSRMQSTDSTMRTWTDTASHDH